MWVIVIGVALLLWAITSVILPIITLTKLFKQQQFITQLSQRIATLEKAHAAKAYQSTLANSTTTHHIAELPAQQANTAATNESTVITTPTNFTPDVASTQFEQTVHLNRESDALASDITADMVEKPSKVTAKANKAIIKKLRNAKALTEIDEQSPSVVTSLVTSLKQWFSGENLIVRVGALVLLVGMVLLIKLASQYIEVPVAVWMALIAIAGLVLTAIGYKTTLRRRGYGLTLQGAGFAMIYLTIFASFRLYTLLPPTLSFVLLAVLAILTVLFSVWQNALPLAVLAFGGAFLAPVLINTPSGNVVMLFSYYLLLNIAVAVIAYSRTWKLLNALSLAVTFGLAYVWGFGQYIALGSDAVTWQTQRWPLIALIAAHMALYIFIAVRYAQQVIGYNRQLSSPVFATNTKQPPEAVANLSIDVGLIFTSALLGFGLLSGLLHDRSYTLALASSVLTAVYLALGFWLLKQQAYQDNLGLADSAKARLESSYQLLIESNLALGMGFLALVLPLALSAKWFTVGWAIQGAALVWLGQRTHRRWTTWFGLALQALSIVMITDFYQVQEFWYSMLDRLHIAHKSIIIDIDLTLPSCVLTLSVMVSAFALRKAANIPSTAISDAPKTTKPTIHHYPKSTWLAYITAIIALLLYGKAINMVLYKFTTDGHWHGLVVALAFTVILILGQWLHQRKRWVALRQINRVLLPVTAVFWLWGWQAWSPVSEIYNDVTHQFVGLSHVGISLVGLALVIGIFNVVAIKLLQYWHKEGVNTRFDQCIWLLCAIALLTIALQTIFYRDDELSALLLVIPTLIAVITLISLPNLAIFKRLLAHPSLGWLNPEQLLADSGFVLLPFVTICAGLLNYDLAGTLLGFYIPLVNPLDIVLIAILIYQAYLWWGNHTKYRPVLLAILLITAFTTISSMLVRSFAYWLQVPIWSNGAWHVAIVQTGLTILWSILATAAMFFASRNAYRGLWFVGTTLLGLVIIKLVSIDMSHTSALLRVISFIGAGVLMLVVGYLAPLPPNLVANKQSHISDDDDNK